MGTALLGRRMLRVHLTSGLLLFDTLRPGDVVAVETVLAESFLHAEAYLMSSTYLSGASFTRDVGSTIASFVCTRQVVSIGVVEPSPQTRSVGCRVRGV